MVLTMTLLKLMGIILTKGTSRKKRTTWRGKVQVKYLKPYVLVVQSLCIQNLHMSEHSVRKLKPQFREVCHAGVQFQ